MTEQLDNKQKISENLQLIKRCHTVDKLVLLLLDNQQCGPLV